MNDNITLLSKLRTVRSLYESGLTRAYEFRKMQLIKLKTAILKYEKEISEALYADLKKNREESYATETGLVIKEINYLLKNLKSRMQPKAVAPGLLNFPSTNKIYRDPLGCVLIIGPWNYPFQLIMLPLAGAIAGGNTVVVKPSEVAISVNKLIARILSEIFTPDYVLCVDGDGSQVVPGMLKSFRFDHIFFTGSVEVGRKVYEMAASQLVPVTLELGGKSPAIVEADAAIDTAAKRIAVAKFINAGQTCIAPDYVLVHTSIAEKFVSQLIEAIESFYSEDAATSYDYGKIINTKRFEQLAMYLAEGTIAYGGRLDKETLYISPTILRDVELTDSVMQQEIFGPILPILTFNDQAEVLNIISQHPDPLSLYVFTSSKRNERKWVESLSFGGGCINNAAWHFTNHHLPFGGVGNSGIGAYHGRYSFDTFTRPKSIMKTPVWFDPKIKYPSFKGRLDLLKRLFK